MGAAAIDARDAARYFKLHLWIVLLSSKYTGQAIQGSKYTTLWGILMMPVPAGTTKSDRYSICHDIYTVYKL